METSQNYASQTVTDCFIVHIKSESIYADLYGDVEKIFDTSNYEVEKQLAIEKKYILAYAQAILFFSIHSYYY